MVPECIVTDSDYGKLRSDDIWLLPPGWKNSPVSWVVEKKRKASIALDASEDGWCSLEGEKNQRPRQWGQEQDDQKDGHLNNPSVKNGLQRIKHRKPLSEKIILLDKLARFFWPASASQSLN